RYNRHIQRSRIRCAVHLPAVGAAERSDLAQGLAWVSLSDRASLRPGGAVHLLRCEWTRWRRAALQPGFLLQSLRNRIAEEPWRDGDGRGNAAGGRKISRDCGILFARREGDGRAVSDLEGEVGRNKVTG